MSALCATSRRDAAVPRRVGGGRGGRCGCAHVDAAADTAVVYEKAVVGLAGTVQKLADGAVGA